MMIVRLFLLFIWIVWLVSGAVTSTGSVESKKKRGCRDSCDNSRVKIPFPFGIGAKCYHNPWYEIVCNSTSSSSGAQKPFLKKFNLEVLNITSCLGTGSPDADTCTFSGLTLKVVSHWQRVCTSSQADKSSQQVVSSIDLKGSPFRFSTEDNEFIAGGCSGQAIVMNRSREIMAGCASVCQGLGSNMSTIGKKSSHNACAGLGCCSTSLPRVGWDSLGIDFYQIGLNRDEDTCMKVAFMEAKSFQEHMVKRLSSSDPFPAVWYWIPPLLLNGTSYDDNSHVFCGGCLGYDQGCLEICLCEPPYVGNPYLPHGCQDPCKLDATFCKKKTLLTWVAVLGLSIGLGSVTLLLCCYGLYRLIKRQRKIKRRAKFFKRNGGLLLQQQMTSAEGVVERTKVFTAKELEQATDNFNANRILGQGGQGTVYKGMLLDGRVVAIKKSKKVDECQLDQFINEVVILSQINHRNVVKLQRCCLETEVPSLVYEFIPNGALSEHIHNHSDDFHITWSMRLVIAAESAGAIAYLHSSSATPIYHRDIKSSNILLDDKYRAKVSDFGTSKTFMIDQTHLTTCVQGTFGYLDPEYFRSHQFTEKSDVYSFGVVLVELLTGMKPVYTTESGETKSLTLQFLYHMENACLSEILDRQVLKEAKEEITDVATLAERCLSMKGKQRPTMKEVATTLDAIKTRSFSSGRERIHAEDDDKVVMDISRIQSGYVSSNTFCSENDIELSHSVESLETQSLMHNTS